APTVATLYVAESGQMRGIALGDFAAAFALGIPLAALAALGPAIEAFHVSPLAAITATARSAAWRRPRSRSSAIAASCFIGAAVSAHQGPVGGLPLFGFLSAILIIMGAACLSPLLLFLLGRPAPR